MSGFGTVVTGTLVDGRLHVGDELEVFPTGRAVRVRGLQQHNQAVESAAPGGRVAANLTGAEKHEMERGDVLRIRRRYPPLAASTRACAASLRGAARAAWHRADSPHRDGGGRLPGDRARNDQIDAGGHGWVQLYLDRPIAVAENDRFILRVPSPASTIAGGTLVDIHPASTRATTRRRVNRSSGAPRARCCKKSCASTPAESRWTRC